MAEITPLKPFLLQRTLAVLEGCSLDTLRRRIKAGQFPALIEQSPQRKGIYADTYEQYQKQMKERAGA